MQQAKVFFLMICMCVMSGCSSYQPGTGSSLKIGNLFIYPVINESSAPQVHVVLSKQVRSAFLSSNINITKKEHADHFLKITLTEYKDCCASPRELTVAVTLENAQGAKIIDNHEITAVIDIDDDIKLFEEKVYQSMPILTQKIANSILTLIQTQW